MEYRVLGPLEVVHDGRASAVSSPRQRALLALLLVQANRTVSTDRILDELWGDAVPDSGRDAVVFHVARLRRVLAGGGDAPGGDVDAGPIRTRDGGYALEVEPDSIDAERFERLAKDGHAGLADDPAGAVGALTAALALWRGEPYEGLGDAPFVASEVRRLDELRLRAMEDRFEAKLSLGRHTEIAAEIEALVDREPLRERLRGLLMIALYRSGRQADALRVYADARRILAEELGIEPSPELQALEAAVLRQAPELLVALPGGAPVANTPIRNPYRGLRPFGEGDADDFFGREALSARLVERLAEVAREGGLLAVVGPSGSGKSSVIRAGLLPALRSGALDGSDTWRIATMFPGSRPFDELAIALRAALPMHDTRQLPAGPTVLEDVLAVHLRSDGRLLLVIDQLEELWTLATSDGVPTTFLSVLSGALRAAKGRLAVVAALRVDQLGAALRSPSLGPLIRAGIELVPPLDRDELRRAIERPAANASLELDPGLADTMVDEVADHPAMLPLLQYALTELTDRADGRHLRRGDYQAIGGVVGALAGRAETTYHALEPTAREVARQVFLHLVAVDAAGAAGARRVPMSTLHESADERSVVERFSRARLLSSSRDARTDVATVEIAHEALVSRWPRLAAWVDEEREAMWLRRRLADAAEEWLERDRDPGFLLTGGRLELLASWATGTDLHLGASERELLEASIDERQRAAAAEAARLAKERRLERRASRWERALVTVFAVAAVLSAVFLALVWRQLSVAAEERAVASARELAVGATGNLEADPQLALLLAAASAQATADRGWITEESLDALHWAIQAARVPYPTEDVPTAVGFARDGAHGIYLLPAADLIELAQGAAGRSLTREECLTWLHVARCPAPTSEPGDRDLSVLTFNGIVPMDRVAAHGVRGTIVRIWSQLPVDVGSALTDFVGKVGVGVMTIPGGRADDPLSEVGRADIAILARPGDVQALAKEGLLIDLRSVLRADEVGRVGATPLVADLGTIGGGANAGGDSGTSVVGVPIAATASSLLWYPADAFREAGYRPPTTWSELEALVAQIRADGRTPWCLGLLGDQSAGASGVDWLEDLVIDDQGARSPSDVLTGWPSMTDPVVAKALRRFYDLVSADGSVLGGPASATRTPEAWVAAQMGASAEPRCWLIHGGADDRARWVGNDRTDLTPIRMPIGADSTVMRGRVYTLVVLRDRPEVRALVRELLAPAFGAQLVAHDGGVSVLPLGPSGGSAWSSSSPSLSAQLAAALRADELWVDASDLMPRALGVTALPAAVQRIVATPTATVNGAIEWELTHLDDVEVSGTP